MVAYFYNKTYGKVGTIQPYLLEKEEVSALKAYQAVVLWGPISPQRQTQTPPQRLGPWVNV